jgi:phosphoglycerate dehydrogenase-like enzyme
LTIAAAPLSWHAELAVYHPAVAKPRVAIGPTVAPFAADAIVSGGGEVVAIGEPADGVVWLSADDVAGLRSTLDVTPGVRWVQLPFAGVEAFVSTGMFGDGRIWTSAKGSYAEPVAEHALTLALAGLRLLPQRLAAKTWGQAAGTSLYDENVVILGGGGITERLLEQLAPFRVRATVVRRRADPMPGAARTVGSDRLVDVLPGALVVFVALALTPETVGIIGARELAAMDQRAWLVNVARGRHVVTSDLLDALRGGAIAGAALDVTDPEPLPDGHPLWDAPNVIITPHTADWPEVVARLLARRIATNVARLATGETLEGLIDPVAGY